MTQTYCVQDLFNLVDSSTRFPKPSVSSIRAYWRALLRWIEGQLVFDRKILIPSFGYVTSVAIQDSKSFILQILTTFLNQNYIQYKDDYQQYTKPVISLHYTAISKMLEKNEEPEWLSKTLDRLFASILNLIITQNANIDLGILGKLSVHEKSLTFEPFVSYKKRQEHRTTVSKLIINKQNSFRIKNKSYLYQTVSQHTEPQHHKFSIFNQFSIYDAGELSQSQKIPFSPNINSSSKNNLNPDFTKHLDMLGEVSDPLGRGYNFSDLMKSPETLLSTTFVKSQFCKPRFPPILDSSVRTLSAPITNQKYNLSISGRIGCNYNTPARSLYFDHKSRSIKNYIHVEGIKFKAQPSLLELTATNKQQLLYLSQGKQQFKEKVEARRKCYERYNEYISKQIPHELVKDIDHSQVKRILEAAGVNSGIAKNPKLEKIINQTLQVIVKDYYYAGRKGILDYALKDKDERERIGIVEILKQYPSWGQPNYTLIMLSDSSKKYIRSSKSSISEHLLLSRCALKIKQQWKQFSDDLFIDLSSKLSPTNLLYFIKKQQQKILYTRNSLRQKWRESVIQLMKQQIKILKQKHQVVSLQRLINALMSNLLRELIQASMQTYLNFFQKFQKQKYRNIDEISADENIVENAFISVKVKDEGVNIIFAENLNTHVRDQLLSLLSLIVEESKDFPSASIKNSFLWEMTNKDEVYLKCHRKINKILEDNIKEVEKAINVYKHYEWILYRQSAIQQWCNAEHRSIEQYVNMINETRNLSNKILNQLPFTIRMNMILVDGTDLKKKFISILSQVQSQLCFSIYTNIKLFYNEIKTKVQLIKSSMKLRVDSTARLLEIQEKMYKIKKSDIPEIKQCFSHLKRWITMLFNQGSELMVESDLMQIFLISKNIHSLSQLLVVEEQRVLIEKQELEKQLRKEQMDFIDQIQVFEKELKLTIKQFTIRKQAEHYNKLIKHFINKRNQYLLKRQQINIKQQHLGWGITKFSQIQQISKALLPPTEFWNIVMVIDTQLKQWGVQSVKNLYPQQIQSTVDKNLVDIKKIYYNQIDNDFLPNLVYSRVNNELLDLKEKYLPLIKIFANKGLKQRHWEAFSKQFPICENKESLTLNKVMGYKMADEQDKIDVLIDISQIATKQFVIEKSKTKMVEEWYPMALTLKEFGDSGINIVGSDIQPIITLLSVQLQKTHAMRELEQAKIFDQSLIEWELWLRFTQTLFTQWMKVQNAWCYLYPLYCDQDIVKNFPLQHAQFESITNSWKSIVRRVQEQPRIVEFTKNKKMLDIFLENNMKLSVMQSTIATFLKQRQQTLKDDSPQIQTQTQSY